MGKTSYITANGRIWGEVTSGVMTSYGTDALGSVVATYSGGAVQNTYRYKPYGSTLAKTGTVADPSFLWNGGSGYLATTLTSANYFVRNRHYTNVGCWLTRDLYWPKESAYGYCEGKPQTFSDYSGNGGAGSGSYGQPPCTLQSLSANQIGEYCSIDTSQTAATGFVSVLGFKAMSFVGRASCSLPQGATTVCHMCQWVYGSISVNGNPATSLPTAPGSLTAWVLDGTSIGPECPNKPEPVNWVYYGLDAPGEINKSKYKNDCASPFPVGSTWATPIMLPNTSFSLSINAKFMTCMGCPCYTLAFIPPQDPSSNPQNQFCQSWSVNLSMIYVPGKVNQCSIF